MSTHLHFYMALHNFIFTVLSFDQSGGLFPFSPTLNEARDPYESYTLVHVTLFTSKLNAISNPLEGIFLLVAHLVFAYLTWCISSVLICIHILPDTLATS